jgi:hypothetical protein
MRWYFSVLLANGLHLIQLFSPHTFMKVGTISQPPVLSPLSEFLGYGKREVI